MRIRTGFSFRKAYGLLPDVMARIETPYAPITDMGATFGFNPWRRECKKAGKRPIYGIDLGLSPGPADKSPHVGRVTLLARDSLEPINRAYALATAQFRFEPLLNYSDLVNLADKCEVILGEYVKPELLPKRHFYYAVGPGGDRRVAEAGQELGWTPVACSNNLYPAPEDVLPFQLLLGRNASTQTWAQHILADNELLAELGDRAPLKNRDTLAELCTAELPMAEPFEPDVPWGVEEWCRMGAKELGVDLEDPVYEERLERELGVIRSKGYQGYFQIIADMCRFARERMFVGPGRGSSSGSLVCYLMGITTVDPIVHDLLFERFLDIGRTDLPDIDMDFSDQHRDEVIKYLEQKYGRDHVCRLGTIAFYRARSLINEIGFGALRIPGHEFEPILAAAESTANTTHFFDAVRSTPQGQKLLRKHPEALVIEKLEGHPRHSSTHASGVVVTERPILEYLAVDSRSDTAQIDRTDSEELGILKIDTLGLRQLSIFEDCLELLGKPRSWLESAALDDPAAFQVLNDGKFSGVFQFNGPSLQGLTQEFTVEEFEDLVAITSLARPGPMNSGGAAKWVRRRTGKEPVELLHKDFEPIVGHTQGIVVYQEQLMQIGLQISEMSWDDVTKLRKVVQYFTGADEMEKFRTPFMEGTAKRGVDEKLANEFWDEILAYGSYAFNRAHAVAYSMLSYWCCYLKAHHPVEYAAGMLNHEKDPERQRIMLRELRDEGVEYTPVDPVNSTLKWQVVDGRLVGPITLVKGMGFKTAKEYIMARNEGLPIPKRATSLLSRPETPLDSLSPIQDAIEREAGDIAETKNIRTKPTLIHEIGEGGQKGIVIVGQFVSARARPDEKNGGQKMTGILRDDTGEIRFFVGSRNFNSLAQPMLESGRVGKTLWAIKGDVPPGGGIVFSKMTRYLGSFE